MRGATPHLEEEEDEHKDCEERREEEVDDPSDEKPALQRANVEREGLTDAELRDAGRAAR